MRPCPLIPCLLAPALLAQAPADPAESRVQQVQANLDPVSPQFVWLRPKDQDFMGLWTLDPDYNRVEAAREIFHFVYGDGEQEAWARRLGWEPGDHWLLISPQGDPLLSGVSHPDPRRLLEAMRGAGWMPRSERLAKFLSEYPDNGDAQLEALLIATSVVSREATRKLTLQGKPYELQSLANPRPLPPDQDQAEWSEVATALNGLQKVEGWTDHPRLLEVLGRLEIGGAKASIALKEPLRHMERKVEGELSLHPSSLGLWMAWSALERLQPGGNAAVLVSGLDPLSRCAWPPAGASGPIGQALSNAERWEELEGVASKARARSMNPAIRPYLKVQDVTFSSWDEWRLLALAKLGRRLEVESFVKELRAESGSNWPDQAVGLAGWLTAALGDGDPIVQSLKAAKDEKPPPDPPKPAFPAPLRLMLLGHPVWEKEWSRYPALSAFDSWEPDKELGWQPLKPDEEKALQASQHLGPEPRWVLMRGSDMLASGADLPRPTALADRLRAEGHSYLEQLDGFIRTHPDRLDAREARMEELRGRMPNERLEASLLEDARITLKPFGPGLGSALPRLEGWRPRKELWVPAARKTMPELDARIRRWPENAELWRTWLDWSSLLDHPPSPAQLLGSLAIWKTHFDGGPGPLPDEVLLVCSERLAADGRWEQLADWCRVFWENGVRDQVRRFAIPLPQGALRRGDPDLARGTFYVRALLSPWKQALEKTGRSAQAKALIQEVADLNPNLAKRLTASANEPPRMR